MEKSTPLGAFFRGLENFTYLKNCDIIQKKVGVIMTTESEIVRASLTDIVERERSTNAFREKLKNLLDTPMTVMLEDYYNEKGVPIHGGTMQDAISASLLLQALAGNIAAYTTIRDTMGYKPAENVKNDVTIKIDMPDRVRELGE